MIFHIASFYKNFFQKSEIKNAVRRGVLQIAYLDIREFRFLPCRFNSFICLQQKEEYKDRGLKGEWQFCLMAFKELMSNFAPKTFKTLYSLVLPVGIGLLLSLNATFSFELGKASLWIALYTASVRKLWAMLIIVLIIGSSESNTSKNAILHRSQL
jgi:hypothetical protein